MSNESEVLQDPFTLLHKAIQDEVLASQAVKLAISNFTHNIIDSNEKRLQKQDVLSSSDVPELILLADAHSGEIILSSSTVGFSQGLTWQIHTGDARPAQALYPITFALACVLTELCYGQSLRTLSWQGKPFVLKSELVSAEHSDEGDPDRGISGYISLFSINCELQFSRQDILKFNSGEVIT